MTNFQIGMAFSAIIFVGVPVILIIVKSKINI